VTLKQKKITVVAGVGLGAVLALWWRNSIPRLVSADARVERRRFFLADSNNRIQPASGNAYAIASFAPWAGQGEIRG